MREVEIPMSMGVGRVAAAYYIFCQHVLYAVELSARTLRIQQEYGLHV